MNLEETYILNPAYALKRDSKRVVLTSYEEVGKELNGIKYDNSTIFLLHPINAQMLAFFDGTRTLSACISEMAALRLGGRGNTGNRIQIHRERRPVAYPLERSIYQFSGQPAGPGRPIEAPRNLPARAIRLRRRDRPVLQPHVFARQPDVGNDHALLYGLHLLLCRPLACRQRNPDAA